MELNATDRQILTKLREGRASPSYLAAELGKQQPYISQRLSRLSRVDVSSESIVASMVTVLRKVKRSVWIQR